MESAAPPPRPRWLRVARGLGFVLLGLLVALDFGPAGQSGPLTPLLRLFEAAGLAALLLPSLLPARWRPAWLTPGVRATVPAVLSLGLTLSMWAAGTTEGVAGLGEAAILLCLLFVAVSGATPRAAAVSAVLLCAALLVLPLRSPDESSRWGVAFVLLLLAAVFAGLGGYLRAQDGRRTIAVAGVRRAERLAIAADLHDFVAHHVTGILVQTQMARMMSAAAGGPAGLDPVLAGIERAATESLASMRNLVGVLRTQADEPEDALTRPAGDLAQLAELVGNFSRVGPKAVLRRDASVPDGLPHEVQSAVFRVVQEALTNVRRHAADATEVVVGLRLAGDALEAAVADDGLGRARLPDAARGGGFGLVGLTERVATLGGELRAGPRPGGGWEVTATLPTGRGA